MRKYLVKRLLLSVVILFFVTFIIYLLMRCMPSSYVENMARQLSQAPGSKPYEEWLAQLNAQYGLDLGLIPGFFVQLKNLCTGNFGDSWKYTVPVIQKFNEVIWVSFIMGAISLVFELLIAVPLGIVAATKQYSVTDYTVTTVALLGMSLPTFFFATLLKLIFCIKLRWFDLVGLTGRDFNSLSQFGQILDMAKHLVLPIVTLVFISIGPWMRYVRTNMLEVLNADYIRTARAKGLSEHKVIYHHAFRNTLIPLVTFIGGSLPGLFAGALITETLFAIPGIAFGYGSGRFKKFDDVAAAMSTAMGNMATYIALFYFIAQFLKYFDWSNLGLVIAIKGANALEASGLPIWMILVLFVLMCCFLNLLIGSASTKWSILASVFVPMFMGLVTASPMR